MIGLRYEGLKGLLQSLSVVNHEMYQTVMLGLTKVGDNVLDDARGKFSDWGSGGSPGRTASFVKAAEGFDTRVRPMTKTSAVVTVGQSLRKSRDLPKRRSNFGDLMMRKALLPARNEKLEESYLLLETEVAELLHSQGF